MYHDPITVNEAIALANDEYGWRPRGYYRAFSAYCTHRGADRDTHHDHDHATDNEARACCEKRRRDLVARILLGNTSAYRTASGRVELP